MVINREDPGHSTMDALEKNLDDLKSLMRKMFGSSDMPMIKKMIKQIETSDKTNLQSNIKTNLKQI